MCTLCACVHACVYKKNESLDFDFRTVLKYLTRYVHKLVVILYSGMGTLYTSIDREREERELVMHLCRSNFDDLLYYLASVFCWERK